MCKEAGRKKEEWWTHTEKKILLFSVVDGVSRWVHSGESSGNGCKMHKSMVTEGDVLRKETQREKGQETGRSEEAMRAEK